MQLPEHGANPHHVYAKIGNRTPARVLDFSENVNPAGPPQVGCRTVAEFMGAARGLSGSARGAVFIGGGRLSWGFETDCLFAGNGAAELLALVAERYRGKRAIVVHPTFSEYEATLDGEKCGNCSCRCIGRGWISIAGSRNYGGNADGCRSCILCTPNNPTGIMPSGRSCMTIIRHGAEVGCDIVLDEAFIDFVDESLSFITEIKENPHVIVVRSMTKMYAIPGIRLGYIVAEPTVIREIKALGTALECQRHCGTNRSGVLTGRSIPATGNSGIAMSNVKR